MAPTVDELRSALAALSLDTRGHKDTLNKRLRRARAVSGSPRASASTAAPPAARTRPEGEDYDSFLVFDVEATCERMEGVTGRLSFAYPNEIIEWPVVLLQWRKGEADEDEWHLEKVDEFQSFVRPTWRPKLSAFCTELTGITQNQVDPAPTYSELLNIFYTEFIERHGLFTKTNRTVWVTDGPWDLRDFISKAAFISATPRPPWLAGKMLDLRLLTATYFSSLSKSNSASRSPSPPPTLSSSPPPDDPPPPPTPKAPPSLNISDVLLALNLASFEGRLHSGISDARNIARILVELQRRGVFLLGNRTVPEGAAPSSAGKAGSVGKEKRWGWMARDGTVEWEEFWQKESRRLSGLNGTKRPG